MSMKAAQTCVETPAEGNGSIHLACGIEEGIVNNDQRRNTQSVTGSTDGSYQVYRGNSGLGTLLGLDSRLTKHLGYI